MRVAVIGAGGFIGRRLVDRLTRERDEVIPVVRTPRGIPQEYSIKDLLTADWASILRGVDVVIHLAARVHQMKETAPEPLAEYHRVNRDGALRVAEEAVRQGVRRFVFVSSIKVNGESTRAGHPFRATDKPKPSDPYGISKLEAERSLFSLAKRTSLEIVVVRPPLVFGPGVGGNFRTMINLLRRRIPLPLGNVTHNRRSLMGVDNLVDLLVVASRHSRAANEVFLVSDGWDPSTTELLRKLSGALGVPSLLVPLPTGLVMTAARLLGRGAAADRLFGNLQVDISMTTEVLNWTPPVSFEDGLRIAVEP